MSETPTMSEAEVEKALAACMILLLPRIGHAGQGDAAYRAAKALHGRWLGAGRDNLEGSLQKVGEAADTVRRAYLQLVTEGLGPERTGPVQR